MSCSPFDLKDYFLQELPSPERVQVEAHVNHCLACREELDRLQLTASALFSLRDEEIPQRIAFVSDQIFEPSPLRRWFTAFWGSTARLGFASALMLSASIFYFAATRPAPAPDAVATSSTAVTPSMAAVTPSPQEVQQQIQQAVAKAVAEVEARQAEKNKQLVADFEHRTDEYLRSVRWMTSESEADRKRAQTTRRMAMYVQPSESGEVK
jgi:anti-sigma factor RsiW